MFSHFQKPDEFQLSKTLKNSFAAFNGKPFSTTKKMILTPRTKMLSKHLRFESLNAHVKWFYGQSDRAYYLNYFINNNRTLLTRSRLQRSRYFERMYIGTGTIRPGVYIRTDSK